MPREYTPKTDAFSETRIKKILYDLTKDAKVERQLVMEAYEYFKDRLEENPDDAIAKVQLGVTLKLLQTSHTKTAEAIKCLTKYEELKIKSKQASKVKGDSNDKGLFAMLKDLESKNDD